MIRAAEKTEGNKARNHPEIGKRIIFSAGEAVPKWLMEIEFDKGELFFNQRIIVTHLEGSSQFHIMRADRECRGQDLIYAVPYIKDDNMKIIGKDIVFSLESPER